MTNPAVGVAESRARAFQRPLCLVGVLLIGTVATPMVDARAEGGGPAAAESHAGHNHDHDHDQGHAHETDQDHDAQDDAEHREAEHDDGGHDQDEGSGHDAHDHGSEPPAEVKLSPEQRRTLGLTIEALTARAIGEDLRAPGEVRLNAYATAQVTPRIAAQVVARHARLGDRVAPGQPLVTLSSVELAEAQGDLVVAEMEWGRLDRMKDKFVSDREYLEASVARQKARSRVLAYGMTQAQIVVSAGQCSGARRRQLRPAWRPRPGPSSRTTSSRASRCNRAGSCSRSPTRPCVGSRPRCRRRRRRGSRSATRHVSPTGSDEGWLDGRVTQIHHRLDETTRTQAVRIEVPDPGTGSTPGSSSTWWSWSERRNRRWRSRRRRCCAAPDGDWQVFVAEGEGDELPARRGRAGAHRGRDGGHRGPGYRHPGGHPGRLLPPVGARQGRVRPPQPLTEAGMLDRHRRGGGPQPPAGASWP